MPWLLKNNLYINWKTREILLTPEDSKDTEEVDSPKTEVPLLVMKTHGHATEVHGLPCDTVNNLTNTESAITTNLIGVPTKYHQMAKVFSKAKSEKLPPHHAEIDHVIELMNSKTVLWGLIYNVSETELGVLKKYIDLNLKLGFIEESKSPCSSPVLFTPKKDNELCLCIDY